MAPKDLDKLIEKYVEGRCTEEERRIIDSLYSSLGDKTDQPGQAIDPDVLSGAENHILQKIQAHVAADTTLFREPSSNFWRYTGIAASLLICLIAGYYVLPRQNSVVTEVAEQVLPVLYTSVENTGEVRKRVILPDGSIVEMYPDSRIRFSKEQKDHSRELFLEGEAYFDIAHNSAKPFYVYAGDVVTKVLGTTFTVRAMQADEKVTVSVRTGKVSVYTRTAVHKKTVLVPNQEAVYDRATDMVATQPVPVAVVDDPDGRIMEMNFEETPVSRVLAMMTEAYDIDIVFREETLSGCVLTSSFYEEGLYDRIDVICTAIGATYQIVDAQIIIESQGCNLKTE